MIFIGAYVKQGISIIWFRQDLRLSDNLALAAASQAKDILPIYILDDNAFSPYGIGGASKVWLHHSLQALNESLHGHLNVYIGKTTTIFASILEKYNIKEVFWNKCSEPGYIQQACDVKKICKQRSVINKEFNSNYLWEADDILKDDGSYYKVFTAYKNKSFLIPVRDPINTPSNLSFIKDEMNHSEISDLQLISTGTSWHERIEKIWDIGEASARNKLIRFTQEKISGYKEGRNFPSDHHTSLLSAHLHYGEISPVQIWKAIKDLGQTKINSSDISHYLSEVVWREYSRYLLEHFNTLHVDNFNKKFNNFPWADNKEYLHAWQTGTTGYPFVDAGMRELWQTGYMHNRVRMVAASFLLKNLNIHWHHGRDWFWDCLVDADLANNCASWQWVAGCGTDAAPFYRIFNPITQGEKFDQLGEYTKKYVPELKRLPNKYLFKPWTAPSHILTACGVSLGKTYPNPIVDINASRKRALELYKMLD